MNEQIREAAQATPKEICDSARKHYEDLTKNSHSWLSTIHHAIDIYEQYLSVKGLPEEEKEVGMPSIDAVIGEHNKTLHLCKLALIKSVPSEEEIGAEICLKFIGSCDKGIIIPQEFDYKGLATALRKLYLEKLGIKEK